MQFSRRCASYTVLISGGWLIIVERSENKSSSLIAGQVRCVVEYISATSFTVGRHVEFEVLIRPRVQLNHLTLFVHALNQFRLKCSVVNLKRQNGAKANFTWYRDGQKISVDGIDICIFNYISEFRASIQGVPRAFGTRVTAGGPKINSAS